MNTKPQANAHPPDKTVILLLILAALGLLLLFFGTRGSEPKTDGDALEAYLDMTERKLCETVARIRGAGTVTVYVTPQSSFETVYTSASAASFGSESSPVVVRQLYPKIGGVLVVCSGGSDETVAKEITNAVSAALGISKNKIYVTSGVG